MSMMDNFVFTTNYLNYQKQLQQDTSSLNDFRVCFIPSSKINYMVLEFHPEFKKESMFSQKKFKKRFFKICLILTS
jgi:hypothetical protein